MGQYRQLIVNYILRCNNMHTILRASHTILAEPHDQTIALQYVSPRHRQIDSSIKSLDVLAASICPSRFSFVGVAAVPDSRELSAGVFSSDSGGEDWAAIGDSLPLPCEARIGVPSPF